MPVPIEWPARLDLALLPTPLEPLSRLSKELGADIWIKRDDLTGTAMCGNKIRKLEFVLAEALEQGFEMVFTCGGIQSNHARATAIAAARLGLSCRLFLRGTEPERVEGNLLLDRLAGAEITWITPEQYREADALMSEEAAKLDPPAYWIPEGASNPLGALGFVRAAEELARQEEELDFVFDAIVHAVGSGGTSAGLILGARAADLSAQVWGVNVCDDEAYFVDRIGRLLEETCAKYAPDLVLDADDVAILDGHVGPGYAEIEPEDAQVIRHLARTEGVLLDPAYTGKAMKGLIREVREGRLIGAKRILFWHTGGIFGLFPKAAELLA